MCPFLWQSSTLVEGYKIGIIDSISFLRELYLTGLFLNLLKFWRLNCPHVDEKLLGFEHNLYVEIDDLDNLEEIDEFLFKAFPENEQYLLFYLHTLERKKSFEKIEEISESIKTQFENESAGVNIGFILL